MAIDWVRVRGDVIQEIPRPQPLLPMPKVAEAVVAKDCSPVGPHGEPLVNVPVQHAYLFRMHDTGLQEQLLLYLMLDTQRPKEDDSRLEWVFATKAQMECDHIALEWYWKLRRREADEALAAQGNAPTRAPPKGFKVWMPPAVSPFRSLAIGGPEEFDNTPRAEVRPMKLWRLDGLKMDRLLQVNEACEERALASLDRLQRFVDGPKEGTEGASAREAARAAMPTMYMGPLHLYETRAARLLWGNERDWSSDEEDEFDWDGRQPRRLVINRNVLDGDEIDNVDMPGMGLMVDGRPGASQAANLMVQYAAVQNYVGRR